MTILLTGATGFLGSHLLEGLLEKNYKVIILKRSFSNCWRIEDFLSEVISYDIDKVTLDSIFEENSINAIIHTATCYGRNGESDFEIFQTNVFNSMELLHCAVKYRTKFFFNTDTLQAMNLNAYTISKSQFLSWGKQSAANSEIHFINMKLEHLYGPKDDETKFIGWFIKQLKDEVSEIKLTAGTQKRDFTYVKDAANAFLVLLDNRMDLVGFEEFEVGTGQSIPVKDFLLQIVDAYEQKGKSEIKSKLIFGAKSLRIGEPEDISANITKLKKFSYEPKYIKPFFNYI
jgi:nucleoside-diphosphate-sugar epimerase